MAIYTDSRILQRCLEQLFGWAFEAEGLSDTLRTSGLSLGLHLREPDTTAYVDFSAGTVSFNQARSETTDLDLYMTADTAHDFWLGKVNVPLAVAKGTITLEGSAAKALMLAALTAPLSGRYREILRDAGLQEPMVSS